MSGPTVADQTPFAARPWLAVYTLCARELVRFFRQPNRIVGAVGQPILFWILFGAGLSGSFRMAGSAGTDSATYREYFFPGTLVMILLFTAIFATISIIEDRREGFLQSVLVAPLPRWAMVLGKLLGGTAIALLQAGLFLLLGLTLGIHYSFWMLLAVIGWLFLLGLALTALGFAMAWQLDSTQGFHALMSVFLFPMWLLSGAFFPMTDNWLGWVVRLNPLTYGVAGLRRLLYWEAPETVRAAALPENLPAAWLCLLVTLGFVAATFTLAWVVAARRTKGDLL